MKLRKAPIPHPPNPFGFNVEVCDAIIGLRYPDMLVMVHEWRRVRSDTACHTATEAAELLLNQRVLAFEFARLEQPSEPSEGRVGPRRSRKQLEAGLRGHRRKAHDASTLRSAIKTDHRFRGEPAIFHMTPGYDGKIHLAENVLIMAYASNGTIIQI